VAGLLVVALLEEVERLEAQIQAAAAVRVVSLLMAAALALQAVQVL